MILRFIVINIFVAVFLAVIGRILMTKELRTQARYPAFLAITSLVITFAVLFLEKNL